MELKDLTREWRVWVLALALLISTLMIFPHYETSDDGEVRIATNLEENMGIEFAGGTRILLSIQDNETEDRELLANNIRQVLFLRMQNYGISDPSLRTMRIGQDEFGRNEYQIQVEVGTSNQTEIRNLISREGSFEARMPVPVSGSKNFTLDSSYTFERDGRNVTVFRGDENLSVRQPGERFQLDNTSVVYTAYNESTETADIEVVAYSGQQIKEVLTSQSTIQGSSGSYQFRFPVVITSNAAQNVQSIAQNYRGLGQYLQHPEGGNARLRMYVDGELQSALNMGSEFQDSVVTQPSISGGGESQSGARQEMQELQAILQSGSLPAPVQVESVTNLSSSLGGEYISTSVLSIIASLVAVGVIVFLRYRDPRIAIPMVITGASEVYILLGFWFTTIGTLGISAVAGIIAAVGTGVDDQIIITDESGKTAVRSWKERMSRAFFVIFTSAASTIGAMAPIISPSTVSLMIGLGGLGILSYSLYSRNAGNHYLAVGAFAMLVSFITYQFSPSGDALATIHGFAWTTILGILIGITITRPAFAKFVEQIKTS